jgi:glycosyltransferase involved in cell wall biosynthesis
LESVPLPGCGHLPGLLTLGHGWLRRAAQRRHFDCLHDPTGVMPFLFGAAQSSIVVTIHDLSVWAMPTAGTRAERLIYRYWLPRRASQADALIADSAHAAGDIRRFLKAADKRVHIVPLGVGRCYRPAGHLEIKRVRARYRLERDYILCLGQASARKNLARLLSAYALFSREARDCDLVVAGALDAVYASGSGVRVLGHVPESDLPALYSGALMFVYPSLYEGFGLPPLEAMACGAPVVCSAATALPEVVGDAALLLDPYDVAALADALRRVWSDAALRQLLHGKGLARAQEYGWERTAAETVKVYEGVCAR